MFQNQSSVDSNRLCPRDLRGRSSSQVLHAIQRGHLHIGHVQLMVDHVGQANPSDKRPV